MTDNDEETFNRDIASTALELLELARQAHHNNGLHMDDAWADFSTDNPHTVLGACVYAIDACIGLSAGATGPAAFDARLGVVRATIMDVLGRAS
jgi:hypothetical protein